MAGHASLGLPEVKPLRDFLGVFSDDDFRHVGHMFIHFLSLNLSSYFATQPIPIPVVVQT